MADINLIEKLSNVSSISGNEEEVLDILKNEINGYVDSCEIDALNNLIALKNFSSKESKVMLNAHMDEVGLSVRSITPEGYLKFFKVGGIDDRVLLGKRVVVGKDKVKGIISIKPIHLQTKSDETIIPEAKDLVIDLGLKTKDEAEKLVKIGDPIVFDTKFEQISHNCYIGKALDDRLGCAIIAETLKEEFRFPVVALFSTQEEVGLRGASVGSFKYTADISITLEGTITADLPDVKEYEKCASIGKGPVITIKDNSVITDHQLREKLVKTAEKHKIPYQFKQVVAGGTDSSKIQLTKSGVRVLVVAVPVRYIHSPVSLFNLADYENTKKLLIEFLRSL